MKQKVLWRVLLVAFVICAICLGLGFVDPSTHVPTTLNKVALLIAGGITITLISLFVGALIVEMWIDAGR